MDVLLYARQSEGDASVTQQLELAAKRATERGWHIVGRFTDRSISASSGEPRPGYDAMMAVIKAGGAKGIVVRHYDRLYRQPRELEGLIDDTEGVHIEAVYGGGYDLGTADGRMQARVVGAFARGEVEKKSERQRDGAQRDAAAGKPRKGCPRPFGWQEDRRTLHPGESEAIKEAARAILGGGTLSGVCRDWTARGVRPAQAPFGPLPKNPWSRSSVKDILLSPRVCGRATYKGDLLAATGQWEPIITVEQWEAVKAVLGHPSRQRSRGVRTMLGGLARCRCGNTISSSRNQLGQPVYRCNPVTRNGRKGPHVAMRREVIDAYVELLTISKLCANDAHALISPQAGTDVVSLRDEAQALRVRRAELGAMFADGEIDRAMMLSGKARADARLAEIDQALADAGREDIFAPLVLAEDTRAAWGKLTTDRKRALVGALYYVTLHPAGRGRKITADPLNISELHELVTTERR